MKDQKLYSTTEACTKLNMSRSTFLDRMKALHIRAVNYNEGLVKQPLLYWTEDNVKAAGEYAALRRAASFRAA